MYFLVIILILIRLSQFDVELIVLVMSYWISQNQNSPSRTSTILITSVTDSLTR